MEDQKLLSIQQAAERLGLRPVTVRLWAARRKLAIVRLGRRRLIPQSEVERLIAENLVPALPEKRP